MQRIKNKIYIIYKSIIFLLKKRIFSTNDQSKDILEAVKKIDKEVFYELLKSFKTKDMNNVVKLTSSHEKSEYITELILKYFTKSDNYTLGNIFYSTFLETRKDKLSVRELRKLGAYERAKNFKQDLSSAKNIVVTRESEDFVSFEGGTLQKLSNWIQNGSSNLSLKFLYNSKIKISSLSENKKEFEFFFNCYFGSDIYLYNKKEIIQNGTGLYPVRSLSPGNPLRWISKYYIKKTKSSLTNAVVILNNGINENYYHDILETLPALMVSTQIDSVDTVVLPVKKSELTDSLKNILDTVKVIFNKNKKNIYFIDDGLHIKKCLILSVINDISKISCGNLLAHDQSVNQRKTNKCFSKIYISRKNSFHRSLINEEDVERLFERKNFKIIYAENYSLKDQIDLFSNASVVAGPHGAGLSNIVFCKRLSKLFELFSPRYSPDCFHKISKIMKVEYLSYLGDYSDQDEKHSPWRVNIDDLDEQLTKFL